VTDPAVGAELALIGRELRGVVPDAVFMVVATRRPVEGSPRDMVSCIRYRRVTEVASRWAVIQRVGFQWSAIVDLDVDTAHRIAIGIARRNDGRQPT
jgi:hypothetical protein